MQYSTSSLLFTALPPPVYYRTDDDDEASTFDSFDVVLSISYTPSYVTVTWFIDYF
ncbi:hypothetical protein JCM10914_395 [Paenibacillus sp. JCM 10914]|nr:hypothetical protein JCM10914_395 [Paenibacillus sp. JCM 10914]